MTNDADEEDSQRCVKNHLQNGVDGNEYRTILAISARQAGPDQDLREDVINERMDGIPESMSRLPLQYI